MNRKTTLVKPFATDSAAKSTTEQTGALAARDLSVEILQKTVDKLPHEADQSTGNQKTEVRPEIVQAKHDIETGQQDTDRAPVTNEVYRRQKRRS